MYKTIRGEYPERISGTSAVCDSYYLRQESLFCIHRWTVSEAENIRASNLKIWDLIPNEVKRIENLKDFPIKMEKWKSIPCTCRICKICLHCIGFLQISTCFWANFSLMFLCLDLFWATCCGMVQHTVLWT